MDGGEGQFGVDFAYSDRGPKDFVLSGPITGGWGPGRWFKTRGDAFSHATAKYGPARVRLTKQSTGRWSFLIKGA